MISLIGKITKGKQIKEVFSNIINKAIYSVGEINDCDYYYIEKIECYYDCVEVRLFKIDYIDCHIENTDTTIRIHLQDISNK